MTSLLDLNVEPINTIIDTVREKVLIRQRKWRHVWARASESPERSSGHRIPSLVMESWVSKEVKCLFEFRIHNDREDPGRLGRKGFCVWNRKLWFTTLRGMAKRRKATSRSPLSLAWPWCKFTRAAPTASPCTLVSRTIAPITFKVRWLQWIYLCNS